MNKFDRAYSLSIEVDDGTTPAPFNDASRAQKNVVIELPYGLEFSVNRPGLASAQTAHFKLHNLGERTRNAIQKDAYQFRQLRAIQLRAGYFSPSGILPLIFNGTVKTAYSYREGEDWFTEIDAYDGGWQILNTNSVSVSQPPGNTAKATIEKLSLLLHGMRGVPIVGNFPVANKRGEVLVGNAWDLIRLKSNGLATIDNGQVKVLNYDEVIAGDIPLLSAATGLLDTPRRGDARIELKTVFEPRLTLYQLVALESLTQPNLNRSWKVMGFSHQGTIARETCGQCISEVSLWFGPNEFKQVQGVPVL